MTTSGRRLALIAGIGAAALAAGAWSGFRYFGATGGAPAGASAIDSLLGRTLPDASGTPVALADFRGRTIVFNFWATWCPPCIEEMPELSAMHDDLVGQGVQVIGIGIDTADNIQRFAEKRPVSYPLLVADGDALGWMRALGNDKGGLPFTLVVDRTGSVRTRVLGRFSEPALRAAVEAANARKDG